MTGPRRLPRKTTCKDQGKVGALRRRSLKLVSGGSQIPKVPSIEIPLSLVVLESRIIRRIGVTLRFPVAVSRLCLVPRYIPTRSRIGDRCRVEHRDRSGKIDVWHVTKRAGRVSVDRELLVEKLELPQRLYSFRAVRCVTGYGGQLCQGVDKDLVNFRLNSFYFLFQIQGRLVL